jgi:hypothetical protein
MITYYPPSHWIADDVVIYYGDDWRVMCGNVIYQRLTFQGADKLVRKLTGLTLRGAEGIVLLEGDTNGR